MKPRLYLFLWQLPLCAAVLCGASHSALEPAGPQAARIHQLWDICLYIGTGVFVLVQIALFYALREGRGNAEAALYAVGTATAVIVPILFYVLFESYFVGRDLNLLGDRKTLTVKITANQWWWDVEYEDPVAANTVYTANEIHIPVGEAVEFKLRSNDVIHSLWIPNLHGKTDIFPGFETITWFSADKPGEYYGLCAEFCGYQHAKMGLLVVAEPKDDFQQWLAHQRESAIASPATENGRALFTSRQCALCHRIRGAGAGGETAPDLTHVAGRKQLASNVLPNSPDAMAAWIRDPQGIKPGTKMPSSQFSANELHDLVQYLESLK